MLEGRAARYRGFKCPHCKLFVPFERAGGELLFDLLSDRHCRKALTVAERYADAEVTKEKLRFAWGDARRAAQVAYRQARETAQGPARPSLAWSSVSFARRA